MRDARLGDVVVSMKNGLYKPASDYADDGTPCLRMYNIEAGSIVWRDIKRMRVSAAELEEYGLLEGDLLVNRVNSRELVGKAALIPPSLEASVFESKNIRVRLDPSKALPKFINYQLLAGGRSHFAGNAQQVVGMASISQKQLADFPIVLADLDEQRRIVAEIEKQLSRLDEAVANLDRVRSDLGRFQRAVLAAATDGSLVGGVPTKAVPISFAIETLDQGWSPQCERQPAVRTDEWAVIKTTAIQPMQYLDVENKRLPSTLQPRPTLELRAGDLLLTRAGPRSRVGVACLVRRTRPRLMLCDKAYRIRVKAHVALPAYLEIALNAPAIADELNDMKTGISDSGVNLTQTRFGELRIPLPALDVQHQIVAEVERRFSLVGQVSAALEACRLRSEALRQSVLAASFS